MYFYKACGNKPWIFSGNAPVHAIFDGRTLTKSSSSVCTVIHVLGHIAACITVARF